MKEENQKIICYTYFGVLTYKVISLQAGISESTVRRRIRYILLCTGKVLFRMEDEFWKEIDMLYE
ncbi:sigma factor-like helix-turn-helix DNA-binding protein [Clostridium kluyveri]|uniref:sigma factor-like helix-turn-helix DNA-binding protein n=1 Tax=Clostridium kluyveri TaxID=1534 RepID=UPI0003093BAE